MHGVSFSKLTFGLILLASGNSVSFAGDQHDLTLEQAMKEIVARKIGGEMRGTLKKEWSPSPVQAQLDPAPVPAEREPVPPVKSGTGSVVYIDPPALALSALRAAEVIVEAHKPPRQVRIVYE